MTYEDKFLPPTEVKDDTDSHWSASQEWRKDGSNFFIIVRHWTLPYEPDYCNNIWNVYALVGKEHPLFSALGVDLGKLHLSDPILTQLYFHGGVTYYKVFYELDHNTKEKVPYSLHIGCDYNHISDKAYREARDEHYSTVINVFQDAQILYTQLQEMSQCPDQE